MMRVNAVSQSLFYLLRCALGIEEKGMDLSALSGEEWRALIDLAFEQGVAAIAVDGYNNYLRSHPGTVTVIDSVEMRVLRYEWFGSVFWAENDYKAHLKAITSLADVCSPAGIKMMVLKGYGLSLNYPVPSHRPTGDIDVYFFGKWWEVDKIIVDKGVKVDYSHHHHSVFGWNGQSVENHYDIVNRYAAKGLKRTDDLLKEMAMKDRRVVEKDGVEFYLPSATFDGVFLLRHSALHFCGAHITLRHLLDWALFVDKAGTDVDWKFVTEQGGSMGLLRFLSCLNAICIDQLGIPSDKFPVLERDSALEQKVLEDILHPSFSEQGSGFFFKCRRLRANMWKRRLVGTEPVVPMLCRLMWSHVIPPEMGYRGCRICSAR